MLKQGTIRTALQESSVPTSLNRPGQLSSWPLGAQMNWGQVPAGNHYPTGNRDFAKEFRVLPAIQNANNNAVLKPEKTGDMDNIEIGTKLNPSRRIEYLEKSIQFLKAQHQELVTSLHEEVDRLQRKNKELQFCIVMMKQNMQTEQGTRKDYSMKRPIAGSGEKNARSVAEESGKKQKEEESVKVDLPNECSLKRGEAVFQLQGSDKLEQLKMLFLEGELKELKRALDYEQKQNQYLTEILRNTQQQKDATTAAAAAALASENNANKSDVSSNGDSAKDGQLPRGISDTILPFGATLDPLLVHIPSQPARPPTLRECQSIARHLQQINNRQAHELNQLKTDLRDVLYSHKWTPDAYLLARAYVADDDAAEATQQAHRSLPRIPMKHSTRKLPDSAYAAQETVTLPPLKTIVGNQAIERQKRTQFLQKTKSAKNGP